MSTSDDRHSRLDEDSAQAGGMGFMVRNLLSSRLDTGMNSEDTPGEEEVNVYLTHLLCAYVDPRRSQEAAHWVAPYDSAVFERVRQSLRWYFFSTLTESAASIRSPSSTTKSGLSFWN